ncbi:bifunctional adenosylcobinamide kinase/adenosylcobinamide-phosphate guanylyltransferase [Streptomyces asiaticus]
METLLGSSTSPAETGSLPEHGRAPDTVLEELRELCRDDHDYAGGTVFNSICSAPLDIARRVFAQHLDANMGDNRVFPSLRRAEADLSAMFGELLGHPGAVGVATSGGTEANLLVVLAAVRRYHDRHGGSGPARIVLPESAHFSFDTAGARAVPDGQTLIVGEYHAVPDLPRRTLVLGGARSGKSLEAERRLAAFPDVLYVATSGTREGDPEWAARVAAHRDRRPGSWRTTETCDLPPLLAEDGPPLLIDCLALWLTDAMDSVSAWDDEKWAHGGERALRERVSALVAAVRATTRTVVAVSNEVGSGVVPATASGRRFRDELGRLNAAFAEECEQVLLVVAGQPLPLRG